MAAAEKFRGIRTQIGGGLMMGIGGGAVANSLYEIEPIRRTFNDLGGFIAGMTNGQGREAFGKIIPDFTHNFFVAQGPSAFFALCGIVAGVIVLKQGYMKYEIGKQMAQSE